MAARNFISDIAAERFHVEALSVEEYHLALRLDAQYADLQLGLADLSVIILAHRYHTDRLLTFDNRHFRVVRPIAGGVFSLLPSDR